ncbi:aldo/keto reductase [Paenibacillus mucilaginosus]|uniref:Aldo/keto reductase n=2 Tax=Paenibacillus mucilaginosus TaxID=61624 RepID=H6NM72_9BACL|nr:aldo/keto reductase [Paenibacillus mucilaginosus]AEI45537.1 aldo/keto reductase [Paenibacillus mucilaginosus KNP414]AFC33234.1 aldo/keto reductase [Paenibacillus mucilaginosus 3016]MCG7215289.1 aldo/keto reductase [Paenibacillus mucilaginosus]WDM26954.1 aldo/keto reductase [Paenibacillus mucilaginosus]WFA21662.1 aldo/keto reductase [Paenibacillus mucilaginosus]
MEQRTFGRTDMKVSVLGFGGAMIGLEDTPLDQAKKLLNTALELGINVIDTSASYLSSEELIGQAVSDRRQDYYLFSKCGEGTSVGLEYPDWDPRNVRPSVERSLKRLQTDYLDLILIHSCTEAVLRQGGLVEEVKKLKRDGLVRYIGYSGDSTDMLYALELGLFDAIETTVNFADQEAIEMTLGRAARDGLGVIAKRPVANVAWSRGKDEPNNPDEYRERLDKLNYPFLEQSSEEILETALRFTLSVPGVHTAIVGTTKEEHLRSNVEMAARGPLPEAKMREIRERWQSVREPAWAGLK